MDRNRSELKQELKTNQVEFQCEPGVCACGPVFVSNPNLIQYQSVDDCVNDNNCCKRWKCDPNSYTQPGVDPQVPKYVVMFGFVLMGVNLINVVNKLTYVNHQMLLLILIILVVFLGT